MAERSIAWTTNATGDGTSGGYSAANWQNMNLKMFITNPATEGVLYGIGNNLAVSGSASPVAVNTGSGIVYGIWYENDASVNVTIPTPASLTRIDRIVLRASWSAQTVRITRIAGTEGGGAPALTQSAGTTWDIPLAQVSITTGGVITLTDQRTWIKHPGVYGWLSQALTIGGALTVNGNITSNGGRLAISAPSAVNDVLYDEMLLQIGTDGTLGALNFMVRGVPSATGGNRTVHLGAFDNGGMRKMFINSDALGGAGPVAINGVLTAGGGIDAPGGLSASQLNSGTVPLARLSGITTTQLSGSAGITDAQIAALDAAKLTSGIVPAARITSVSADAIDDTMVGNRVTQFFRRQGGSATDWSSAGTSTQTPAMVRMQAGVYTASASASPVTITFPVAFSQPPIFVATGNGDVNIVTLSSITSSQANIIVRDRGGSYLGGVVNWIAIGPE